MLQLAHFPPSWKEAISSPCKPRSLALQVSNSRVSDIGGHRTQSKLLTKHTDLVRSSRTSLETLHRNT